MSASRPYVRAALLSVCLFTLLGCEGYADLPLALRERGDLRIERSPRFSEGPSRVELTLLPPSDATGPFVIVGPPTALSPATVETWAVGPCSGASAADSAIRLCLSVRFDDGATPLALALVVESRADARRFTLAGAETAQ
jgi:hypothetical protein